MQSTSSSSSRREIVSKRVIESRLEDLIERGRTQANGVFERLQKDAVKDQIARVGANGGSTIQAAIIGCRIGVEVNGTPYSLHNHALGQLGGRLGLPTAWLREWGHSPKPWQRESVADVLATTLSRTDRQERLLIRSVDDEVRGVLSDAYRRISSTVLMKAFAAAIKAAGMTPYRATYSDVRWDVGVVLTEPFGLRTPDGVDYVAAMLGLRNSDFGASAMELTLNILRLACINGMTGQSIAKQVHLGRRLPDDIRLSESTYQLDTRATAAVLRDTVKSIMEPAKLQKRLEPVQAAAEDRIDASAQVEGLVRAKRLTKTEGEAVTKVLVERDPSVVPTGDPTRWQLANAISSLAHADGLPVDRRDELEAVGGQLLFG